MTEPAKHAAGASRAETIARAAALVPGIRARAAEAERTRRLPEATMRELHESGLLRVLQPRRVGGAELDYGLLVEIGAIFGAACGSTAWVWGNLASHHWMLAMWPARAQHEIWGADPDAVIGSAFVFPSGRAKKVPGGYEVSGRWPFSSGIVHSSWLMVGAMVEAAEGAAPEMRMFLLPPGGYSVIDTWHVSGLCATGSHDVSCATLFVADDFTLSVEDTKRATAPGLKLNPGPLYRIPVFAAFSYIITGALLGMSEGAVEHYTAEAKKRASSYTGGRMAELAPVQIKIAAASASCDAARLLMVEDCRQLAAQAEANETPDELARGRYRRNSAFAAKLCLEAVDLMVAASGGAGIYDKNPIQRAFRDAHAAASHISLTWDAAATIYGRVALGLPSGNATI
ncbi:MAG TPA: acyl-CoA dehydrogenase family protein [Alphaproteobacteria bacterium]|nr:acyl-CoA dehydrogenase family protein [Alphaproteobacteria bacterium]